MEASFDYEFMRRITYEGGATFVPVCKKCGRFVKADARVYESEAGLARQPNATCKKCGRTEMVFEGFI